MLETIVQIVVSAILAAVVVCLMASALVAFLLERALRNKVLTTPLPAPQQAHLGPPGENSELVFRLADLKGCKFCRSVSRAIARKFNHKHSLS
jgi:hypothetical protein